MAIYGNVSDKNHGFGRRMSYAGTQVLKAHFGGGHFSSVASHAERWSAFSAWAKENGISDMRSINQEIVSRYAGHMRESGLSVATAQNRISTINVVMMHAREGKWATISPREMVGESRSQVRTDAPTMLDRSTYAAAVSDMRAAGLDRAAAILSLSREFGMRSEECAKANLDRLAKEAFNLNKINLIDGTKGGRDAPRWVQVTPAGREAIQAALAARPEGSLNIISPRETYKSWREGELRSGREILHSYGTKGYHDARAAFACERYQILTGRPAPAVVGHRSADRETDRAARGIIARELGHGRADVARSYVGSSR